MAVEALNGLTGDLAGRYYRLSEMTEREQQQLIDVSQCSSWPLTPGAHGAGALPWHCLSGGPYLPFPAPLSCGTRTPCPSKAALRCRGCCWCCSALPSQGRMELTEDSPSSSWSPQALAPCPCLCPGEGGLMAHGQCLSASVTGGLCTSSPLPPWPGRQGLLPTGRDSRRACPAWDSGSALTAWQAGTSATGCPGTSWAALQPHTLCLPPGPLPLRQAGVPAPDGSRNGPGLARRPRDLVRIFPGIGESAGQKWGGGMLPHHHHPSSLCLPHRRPQWPWSASTPGSMATQSWALPAHT